MKRHEVEKEMSLLRKSFDVVRLLREDEIPRVTDKRCECFKFWNKNIPCDNCISIKTLRTKEQNTKIEFLDDTAYFVMSKYIDIDGKPYVIEMLRRLEYSSLVDSYGRKTLIDKLESYEQRLYRDPLTGLYNHNYYIDEVRNQSMPMGVALFDLDDFKEYNEKYGHSVGDDVLVTVAKEIEKFVRKTDIFLRYGGDEFLLILPDITEDIFENKLNQIKNHIHSLQAKSNAELPISLSVGGVVTYHDSVGNTLQYAEKCLRQAKLKRNTVVVGKQNEDVELSDFKQNILIVDDSEMNREIISDMLREEYNIYEAKDGQECIRILSKEEKNIALVLLDIVMPNIDGFGVLDYMSRHQLQDDIPVIMISSDDSRETIRKAYDVGASDYISRPFDRKIVHQRVNNAMKLYSKQKRLISIVTKEIHEKEKNSRMLVNILSHIVEFRNKESGEHVLHLQTITSMLLVSLMKKTDKYHLTAADCNLISMAAVLHDIGKIGIPEEILNKPGKLTDEEFNIMKTHTTIGYEILENLRVYEKEPLIIVSKQICRWHHEKWDGRGYPDRLKGEQIPIAAQVVSLADVYDALTSERAYKRAYTHQEAIQMILNGECGQFNPILLECLLDTSDALELEVKHEGM
jgi:putative two-component system response regulator